MIENQNTTTVKNPGKNIHSGFGAAAIRLRKAGSQEDFATDLKSGMCMSRELFLLPVIIVSNSLEHTAARRDGN
jgi:hypothetical protein